ncbi:MAG: class E sortase [Actinomycetota bacterium]|nr:class E sortase [Actinomycetota bacterium]
MGLFLLTSLAVLVFGGLLFFSIDTAEQAGANNANLVERVRAPLSPEAPGLAADVAAEKAAREQAAAEQAAAEKKAAEERAAAEKKAAEERAAEEAKPPPPEDPTTFLTVPRLGLYGSTVRNDDSPSAMDLGAIKLPSTGFPWQGGANTYIAAHRIGWPGTESNYQFYNLPAMQMGDLIYLTDMNGTVYTYQVTEIFAVYPHEAWVTNPIAGRDMITLQTCTETPNDWWTIGPKLFASTPDSGRLVVRADKVATDYAV